MKNKKIIGALMGLVGAIENQGKEDWVDELVIRALHEADNETILEEIHAAKDRISPSCKICAYPCGNTGDAKEYLENLTEEEYRWKVKLLDAISHKSSVDEHTYRVLSYLRYNLDLEVYEQLWKEITQ